MRNIYVIETLNNRGESFLYSVESKDVIDACYQCEVYIKPFDPAQRIVYVRPARLQYLIPQSSLKIGDINLDFDYE